jgi:hypothetical protein
MAHCSRLLQKYTFNTHINLICNDEFVILTIVKITVRKSEVKSGMTTVYIGSSKNYTQKLVTEFHK